MGDGSGTIKEGDFSFLGESREFFSIMTGKIIKIKILLLLATGKG
jgi:hypothetical protein